MSSENLLSEEGSLIDMSLEPVLVLARLAQISLYPIGSKLYLRDGMIRIHTSGFMQPMYRWVSGDSREDLTYLFEPIRKFTDIYRTKTTKVQKEAMRQIIHAAVTGLEKLRETYGSHRIVDHSLAYYQTFLIQCADLKVYAAGVKRSPFLNLPEGDDDIPPLELSTKVLPEPVSQNPSKTIGVWTMDDIYILSRMIEDARDADGNDQITSRLNTIESFLETKELAIRDAMRSSSRP